MVITTSPSMATLNRGLALKLNPNNRLNPASMPMKVTIDALATWSDCRGPCAVTSAKKKVASAAWHSLQDFTPSDWAAGRTSCPSGQATGSARGCVVVARLPSGPRLKTLPPVT